MILKLSGINFSNTERKLSRSLDFFSISQYGEVRSGDLSVLFENFYFHFTYRYTIKPNFFLEESKNE